MLNTRICPETGAELRRGVRQETLSYKGFTATFEMPGWYPEGADEGIHNGDDMEISDCALNRLKAQATAL